MKIRMIAAFIIDAGVAACAPPPASPVHQTPPVYQPTPLYRATPIPSAPLSREGIEAPPSKPADDDESYYDKMAELNKSQNEIIATKLDKQGRIQMLKNAIVSELIDPESARFYDVGEFGQGTKTLICGQVNAKNRMGGYTGKKYFFGAGSSYVMEPTFVDYLDERRLKAFLRVFDKHCTSDR